MMGHDHRKTPCCSLRKTTLRSSELKQTSFRIWILEYTWIQLMTLKFNSTSDHARSSASPTTLSPLPPLISYMYTTLTMAMATLLGTPNVSRSGRTCCYPDSNGVTYPSSNNPSENFRFSQTHRWSPSFGIPNDITDGKTQFMEMFTDTTLKLHRKPLPCVKKCKKYPWNQGARLSGSQWHLQGPGWILGQLINCWKSGLFLERVGKSVKPSILGCIFEMSKVWQPSQWPSNQFALEFG